MSDKTKTYFTFRIDVWDHTGINIFEHIAGLDDLMMAMAAYNVAVTRRPRDKITLRQGARVILKNWESSTA